jgi:hypothetical protein
LQFREYGLGGAQASRNIKMSDKNDNAFTIWFSISSRVQCNPLQLQSIHHITTCRSNIHLHSTTTKTTPFRNHVVNSNPNLLNELVLYREEWFRDDSTKEMKLLKAESMKIRTRKNKSVSTIILDSLSELNGWGGYFTNSGGECAGGWKCESGGIVIGIGVRVSVDCLEETRRVTMERNSLRFVEDEWMSGSVDCRE